MSAGGRYYPTAIREGTHEIRRGTHEIRRVTHEIHMDTPAIHKNTHVNFWVQMIPITPQQSAGVHMNSQGDTSSHMKYQWTQ